MTRDLIRLGIITTYRCNAECRHCFFNAGPNREETITFELAKKGINESAGLGAQWVSLTGGEPLLEPDLAADLLEYSSDLGLKTELVTNGFWGKTSETARKTLEFLCKHGLDVINLSIDDFHQEHIPLTSVKNVYDTALDLGLKIVIMTTTSKSNKITANTIPELLNDTRIQILGTPRIRDPNALLIETPVTPTGRRKQITKHEYTLITNLQCNAPLRDIGLAPDGSVYPCCGPLASMLSLGNLKEQSLEKILSEAEKNQFYSSIRSGGPVSGAFTSKCHACLSLID
jgi:radical SAM protein with 4Fe4S-binding SPASM domain